MYYVGHSEARDTMYANLRKIMDSKLLDNKRIYMFGANKIASMIISFLKKEGICITGIIDNDKRKQGHTVDSVLVTSPDCLFDYNKDTIILIASSYQNKMIEQLQNMGYELEKNIIKVIDLPELMDDYSFVDRAQYEIMPDDEIRKRQFDIMKFLKDVCEKNNIKYYLGYGTLLGAVRHQGFIPWDDDVDIYVAGRDIDRLAEIINLSNRYEMITCKNCECYYDQVVLMVDKQSVVDLNCFPLQATTGISIDIFPLYGLPEKEYVTEYTANLQLLEMKLWNCLSDSKESHKVALEINNYIASYDFEKSKYTGFFLSPYFIKDCLRTELFGNPQYLKFENEEFAVPAGYKDILNTLYGDYMKLPPIESRRRLHYYKVYYPYGNKKDV